MRLDSRGDADSGLVVLIVFLVLILIAVLIFWRPWVVERGASLDVDVDLPAEQNDGGAAQPEDGGDQQEDGGQQEDGEETSAIDAARPYAVLPGVRLSFSGDEA